MLTDFTVIHAAGDFDGRGTLVHSYDGRQLVLAAVTHNALEDHFRKTSLSTKQLCLLVDRNISAIGRIISKKYAESAFQALNRAGMSFPLVIVTLHDIERSGEELTDTVLQIHARSGFVGSDGKVQRS